MPTNPKATWREELRNLCDEGSEFCMQDCHPNDRQSLFDFIARTLASHKEEMLGKFEGLVGCMRHHGTPDFIRVCMRLDKLCPNCTSLNNLITTLRNGGE